MRRRAATTWVVLLGAAVAGAIAACQTVDLGTPPADLNACRPSQAYFKDQIWNVLSKDYGGRHCYDAGCHDKGSGRPLTLELPTDLPTIPLTGTWAANYISAAEQMKCSNAASSDLIMLPTNQRTHGGQMLFAPGSDEAQTIEMWPSVHP